MLFELYLSPKFGCFLTACLKLDKKVLLKSFSRKRILGNALQQPSNNPNKMQVSSNGLATGTKIAFRINHECFDHQAR
jgi:hypothetical protein